MYGFTHIWWISTHYRLKLLQLVPGSPLTWPPAVCDLSKYLIFLTIWYMNMLQTHVVYLLPQAWNQPFLQEAWFLLIGKGIWRPQSGYSVCLFLTGLVLVSSFSADSIHLCDMSEIKYSISSNHFRFRFKL